MCTGKTKTPWWWRYIRYTLFGFGSRELALALLQEVQHLPEPENTGYLFDCRENRFAEASGGGWLDGKTRALPFHFLSQLLGSVLGGREIVYLCTTVSTTHRVPAGFFFPEATHLTEVFRRVCSPKSNRDHTTTG